MKVNAEIVRDAQDNPLVRLDLHEEPDGFQFWQTTYRDYEICKKAHADGVEGFAEAGEDDKAHLTYRGHRIRPA